MLNEGHKTSWNNHNLVIPPDKYASPIFQTVINSQGTPQKKNTKVKMSIPASYSMQLLSWSEFMKMKYSNTTLY